MITIVSALRGNKSLTTRWMDQASQIKGEDVKFWLSVTSADDKEQADNLGAKYIESQPNTSPKEQDRINHIGRIYEELIRKVEDDKFIMWDDDIFVRTPRQSVSQLIKRLEQASYRIAGFGTVYSFKQKSDT